MWKKVMILPFGLLDKKWLEMETGSPGTFQSRRSASMSANTVSDRPAPNISAAPDKCKNGAPLFKNICPCSVFLHWQQWGDELEMVRFKLKFLHFLDFCSGTRSWEDSHPWHLAPPVPQGISRSWVWVWQATRPSSIQTRFNSHPSDSGSHVGTCHPRPTALRKTGSAWI